MYVRVSNLEDGTVKHEDLAPMVQWQNWMERQIHHLAAQLNVQLEPKPPRP